MKCLAVFFTAAMVLFMATVESSSAAPGNITYQGALSSSSGEPVPDGIYAMDFGIYADSMSGEGLWYEYHPAIQLSNGMFTVILGSSNPIPDWIFQGDVRFLGITIGDEALLPRTLLTSHPYSFHVASIDGSNGGTVNGSLTLQMNPAKAASSSLTIVDTTGSPLIEASAALGVSTQVSFYDPIDSKSGHAAGSLAAKIGSAGITMYSAFPDTALFVSRTGWLRTTAGGKFAGTFIADSTSSEARVLSGIYQGVGPYDAIGVFGQSIPQDWWGIGGQFQGGFVGVQGLVQPTGDILDRGYAGVSGSADGGIGQNAGVAGYGAGGSRNYGLFGQSLGMSNVVSGINYGLYAEAGGAAFNWAGYFIGNVHVNGTLSKLAGSFRIDHPLDPENKYLSHSFVESPDMKNVYDGVVQLDRRGEAWVTLPDYFEVLNRDFRYQLTPIGASMPDLYVANEISGNAFSIAGGKPGAKVSWQVTGIRQDPYANMHPIQVEEDKPSHERGLYLAPEAYNQPLDRGVNAKSRPGPGGSFSSGKH